METPPEQPRIDWATSVAQNLLKDEEINTPAVPIDELLEQYATVGTFNDPCLSTICYEQDSLWHVEINENANHRRATLRRSAHARASQAASFGLRCGRPNRFAIQAFELRSHLFRRLHHHANALGARGLSVRSGQSRLRRYAGRTVFRIAQRRTASVARLRAICTGGFSRLATPLPPGKLAYRLPMPSNRRNNEQRSFPPLTKRTFRR